MLKIECVQQSKPEGDVITVTFSQNIVTKVFELETAIKELVNFSEISMKTH